MLSVAASSILHQNTTVAAGDLRVVRGRRAVLEYQSTLEALCRLTGQDGEADNLDFFLHTRDALKKRPCLILFPAPPGSTEPAVDGFCGAVFLFEYMLGPIGLRIFATADFSGRRNVLGREELRSRFATMASMALMTHGAQVVLISFQAPTVGALRTPNIVETLSSRTRVPAPWQRRMRWSLETREIPLYLRLEPTLDATLAGIGQKTRANLRYYRRRAEAQLGCTFVPQVELTLEEFLALNRSSAFAVPDDVAEERWHGLKRLKHPLVCGIQASDGRWLSLVCGWRRHNAIEIIWQMNLASLPEYSLATVMRSFLIDYAVRQGCERLQIEGGTNQAIRYSFAVEPSAEVTMLRGSWIARTIHRYAAGLLPQDNHLAGILARKDLYWRDGGPIPVAGDLRRFVPSLNSPR